MSLNKFQRIKIMQNSVSDHNNVSWILMTIDIKNMGKYLEIKSHF